MAIFLLEYALFIVVSAGIVVGIYFLFRKSSDALKRCAVLILILLNLLQHIGKSLIWPHLFGTGFGRINTAYNVCATLICIAPILFLFGKGAIKDTTAYLGIFGPGIAMLVPTWFFGKSLFTWEALRFYVCHILLFATSLLPILWKLHRPSWKSFLWAPLVFLLIILIIIMNTIVCYQLGMYDTEKNLFDVLYYDTNPCWFMHPPFEENLAWARKALDAITFPIFSGRDGGYYTPVLWYFIPMYIAISLVAFVLGILFDRKRFTEACRAYGAKRKERKKAAGR